MTMVNWRLWLLISCLLLQASHTLSEATCDALCPADTPCVANGDCSMAVTYEMDEEGNVLFTLKTTTEEVTDNFWMAVALGNSNQMSDASTMICKFDASGQVGDPYMAWISGQVTPKELEDPSLGLSDFESSVEDNLVSCSFRRARSVEVPIPDSSESVPFDLQESSYYLLVARGEVNEDDGSLKQHSGSGNSRFTSSNSVSLSGKSLCDLCTTDVNCIFVPPECTSNCNNCNQVLTYKADSESNVDFMLATASVGNNRWNAVALSFDDRMGNDSVMACFKDREGEASGVFMYQTTYEEPEEPEGTAIRDSKRLTNPSLGISNSMVVEEDDVLKCSFTRDRITDIDEYSMTFDLLEDRYHIFVGEGSIRSSGEGVMRRHIDKPYISRPLSLTASIDDEMMCEGCGTDFGCFVLPDGCHSDNECSCTTVLAFNQLEDGSVDFSMRQANLPDDVYVTMAISEDQTMGDDEVVGCFRHENHGLPYRSYNEGRDNFPITEEEEEEEEEAALTDISFAEEEGVVNCSFNLAAVTKVSELDNLQFDLANTNYYLFLAQGPVLNAEERVVGKHNELPAISPEPVDLSSKAVIGGQPSSNTFVKLHASFMVLAWLSVATLGTFFARYNRHSLAPMHIMKKDAWFTVHQLSMLSTLLLLLSGALLIVIDRGVSPLGNISLEHPHSALGLVSSLVAIGQVVAAFFRPGPQDESRVYFNLIHRTGGIVAVVTALAAIATATITNDLLNLGSDAAIVVWTAIGVVVGGHILANVNLYVRRPGERDPITGTITITVAVTATILAIILTAFIWTT